MHSFPFLKGKVLPFFNKRLCHGTWLLFQLKSIIFRDIAIKSFLLKKIKKAKKK